MLRVRFSQAEDGATGDVYQELCVSVTGHPDLHRAIATRRDEATDEWIDRNRARLFRDIADHMQHDPKVPAHYSCQLLRRNGYRVPQAWGPMSLGEVRGAIEDGLREPRWPLEPPL